MVHFNKIKITSHLFFSTLPRSHAKTKGEQEEEGQREVMERVCNSCLLWAGRENFIYYHLKYCNSS